MTPDATATRRSLWTTGGWSAPASWCRTLWRLGVEHHTEHVVVLISRSPFFIWSDYFTFHFSSIFIMLARHYHDKCARIRCFCRNEKRARVPGNCKRCAASYSSAPTTASPLAETGIQVLQRHWPGIKFESFFFKYYSSTQSYFAVKFNTRPMDF